MKTIKVIFYSTFILCTPLLLSACGSDEKEPNVNLSEVSSDEDDVTSEYYDEIENDEYYNSILTIADGYNNLLSTSANELQNKEKLKEDAEKYLTLAVTERVQPSTAEENDIDEYFFKFLSTSKSSAEYYIKFANEGDKMYLDFATDYMKDAIDNMNIAGSIAEKYGYE